jgi:hypothetical protein
MRGNILLLKTKTTCVRTEAATWLTLGMGVVFTRCNSARAKQCLHAFWHVNSDVWYFFTQVACRGHIFPLFLNKFPEMHHVTARIQKRRNAKFSDKNVLCMWLSRAGAAGSSFTFNSHTFTHERSGLRPEIVSDFFFLTTLTSTFHANRLHKKNCFR